MKTNRNPIDVHYSIERALRAVYDPCMRTVDVFVSDSINDYMWVIVSGSIWDIVAGSIDRRVGTAIELEFKSLRRRSK